jgi:hypothetical protein
MRLLRSRVQCKCMPGCAAAVNVVKLQPAIQEGYCNPLEARQDTKAT